MGVGGWFYYNQLHTIWAIKPARFSVLWACSEECMWLCFFSAILLLSQASSISNVVTTLVKHSLCFFMYKVLGFCIRQKFLLWVSSIALLYLSVWSSGTGGSPVTKQSWWVLSIIPMEIVFSLLGRHNSSGICNYNLAPSNTWGGSA